MDAVSVLHCYTVKSSRCSRQTPHASLFIEEQSHISYKQDLIKWELQEQDKYV